MRDIEDCLPPRLHSFSRQVLEIYLMGHMSTAEFRRWFHMPNSDYLMLGDCIAQKVDPHYVRKQSFPLPLRSDPIHFESDLSRIDGNCYRFPRALSLSE